MSAHQMLFAKISFVGFSETFTSGSTTVNIPPGAAQVQVQAWGGGGGGGFSRAVKCCQNWGGGGGSGAYVKKNSITIPSANWGNTISYTVGAAGTGGVFVPAPSTNSTSGGNTSVSSGTFTIPTSILAPGGSRCVDGSTGTGGAGGTPASGGDVNTDGNPGSNGPPSGTAPGGTAITSPGGTSPSGSAGAGGRGGSLCGSGVTGGAGQIIFTWS